MEVVRLITSMVVRTYTDASPPNLQYNTYIYTQFLRGSHLRVEGTEMTVSMFLKPPSDFFPTYGSFCFLQFS